ncbi:MAG: histidine kinase [Bacteroidota bacterium]
MNNARPLNDRAVKFLCIPALGILIPNVTGLISNKRYPFAELVLSYLYFISVAFVVWEGNVRLMYFIKKRFAWQNGQYYKIIISLFFANVVYSGLISASMLYLWKIYSKETYAAADGPIINTSLIIIIAATFITNIYEMVFLNDERELNISKVEQLNVAKAQAELEALKNQIDPHFIFNSLNTLSFLIMRDPLNAKLFNDTLAKVYRYILGNKDKDLVLLREEVEFISNYFYLLKIRFQNAVNMEIEINDLAAEDFLIPPISMQALVENAIKHNDFNDSNPLNITVSISSNYIIVKNAIKPKGYMLQTSKIGLSNLDNRYKLITKKNIIIENNPGFFSVKLPVLKF